MTDDWWIRDLTPDEALEISTWSYPEPYSFYDSSPGDTTALLDPDNGYFAVVDGNDALVGYGCLGPDARVPGGSYGADATDIGFGMRPDLTGQGHGSALTALVVAAAEGRSPGRPLRVTIASFNERSIHLWRRAGFGETEIFRNPSGREFVILVRD